MVVPLIFLGTVTKLAFAVAVTYRTRLWWLPGVIAMLLGIGTTVSGRLSPEIGEMSMVLGLVALVVAFTARSSRTAPAARSSRRGAR